MKRLRVPVTREDIRNGNPAEADSCPLYLAIDRAAHLVDVGAFPAYVDGVYVAMEDPDRNCVQIYLPQKAVEFAERFDMTGKGRPFVFTLDLEDINP